MVDVGAVVTCGVFTHCDAECTAMEDPTFFVRVVTNDNDIAIVPLGDTTFISALDDFRVFAELEDSVLISPLGDPTFHWTISQMLLLLFFFFCILLIFFILSNIHF